MPADSTKLPLRLADDLRDKAHCLKIALRPETEEYKRSLLVAQVSEYLETLATRLSTEQPEGRSYDRCAHIGSPYAAGTRGNMPCRIPRKDHLEAGDETESGYLFDHDFVGPTEQAQDAFKPDTKICKYPGCTQPTCNTLDDVPMCVRHGGSERG